MSKNEHNTYRGLHVVVINPSSGQVESANVYDTSNTSDEMEKFIDSSDSLPGHIVAAACMDDCV